MERTGRLTQQVKFAIRECERRRRISRRPNDNSHILSLGKERSANRLLGSFKSGYSHKSHKSFLVQSCWSGKWRHPRASFADSWATLYAGGFIFNPKWRATGCGWYSVRFHEYEIGRIRNGYSRGADSTRQWLRPQLRTRRRWNPESCCHIGRTQKWTEDGSAHNSARTSILYRQHPGWIDSRQTRRDP